MVRILGIIMAFCYKLFNNYGIAIILFTLISKIVLLPLSIWVQKNSIKMVKMQPMINKIKIKFFGDKDKISDETSELYKKEKYNAFASLIPLFIQIALLMGLVEVINHPLDYIVKFNEKSISNSVEVMMKEHPEVDKDSSSKQLVVVNDIKTNKVDYSSVLSKEEINDVKKLNMKFLGIDLSWVAVQKKGIAWIIPLIAGLSSLILCIGQNMMNVLQKEQGAANKYGMLVLSVGLSVYLGMFVPAGVALYWTASNLLAVLQQWLLNIFINPKKYVDYEELEKTRIELDEMMSSTKVKRTKEQIKKEKQDYKKFFSIVNKHLVFYSESNGFYKYYKGVIDYILENTNITIHYITSDYNDSIFDLEKENSQIKAYYIGDRKLITLMMKLDADVVVMTMPDLETYHIKRSYLRKDICYLYYPHGQGSTNLTLRPHATDHYDVVFTTGKHQQDEELIFNKKYKLNRVIFPFGYPLLDDMIEKYNSGSKKENKKKTILIAPSWQKDNIVDLCLEEILDNLKNENYNIIVRPHPQHVRHKKEYFDKMKSQYENSKNIEIQTDFTKTSTVFDADLVITDWSDIGFEYAFTTKKPVLYIDTPMKIMNPNYQDIDIEPINVWARNKIGKSLKVDELNRINETVKELLKDKDKYNKAITKVVNEYVYNLGNSSEVGANYIIDLIQKKIKERSKK
jgi:YidC/Oxa1 family membrane protein insertase